MRQIASLLFLLCVWMPTAWSRPRIQVPDNPSEVLERLPRGYASLMPRPAATSTDAVDQATRMLVVAARSGDTRLARRAGALLDSLPPENPSLPLLRARAFSAQHRHDFGTSLRLLERLVAADPRDGESRLAHAQIQLVQGRLDRARADCGALAIGVDSGMGLVCVAAVALRTGKYDTASRLLDQWLQSATADDPLRRYVTTLRADASFRAGRDDADRWFRAALALDPDDVRSLSAYARFLLASGRAREVRPLLARAGDNDLLQLQRTLAAVAAGDPDAAALADAQARRYGTARTVGVPAELRDEAEFLLTVRRDAVAALALASENFRQQRDYEDVRLLQRAALASDRPDALVVLEQWAASEQLRLEPAAP